jgi:transposase
VPRVFDVDIKYKLEELESVLRKRYRIEHPVKDRDWRTYEQEFSYRIQKAITSLDPLIREAVSSIKVAKGPGKPGTLTLEQKVKLLLIKQLVGESNGMFSNMLAIFSMLSGVRVSYKSIERLYSDERVIMALYNLHTIMLRRKGLEQSDATGDGTGYSLTITKHYQSVVQRMRDGAKEQAEGESRKKCFVFTFRLMDLGTRMYIAYGNSMRSEKDAFERAMVMLKSTDVRMNSIRLDRYYSRPSYVNEFGDTDVYVIPKKNSTLNGPIKWRETMMNFVLNTSRYMEEYHKRSNSESAFSADKKMLGWNVSQKRYERIDCALSSIEVWHNLFQLGRS